MIFQRGQKKKKKNNKLNINPDKTIESQLINKLEIDYVNVRL